MNVQTKIRSLILKKKQFFAMRYDWSEGQLRVHETYEQYIADLKTLREEQGIMKRAQYYFQNFLNIKNKLYAVYLVSYGEIRKWKFMYGENPIAKQFGVCMFDHVFCFVQPKQLAQEKISFRINVLEKQSQQFLSLMMKRSRRRLFHKQIEEQSYDVDSNPIGDRDTNTITKNYIDTNFQSQI